MSNPECMLAVWFVFRALEKMSLARLTQQCYTALNFHTQLLSRPRFLTPVTRTR